MTARGELEQVWRALTANAAKALRLPEYGIEVGHPADLIVLDDWSASDAVLNRAERLAVFKRGQIVHRSERFGVEGGVAATERAHV
jgi:cytosine deaminase